MTTLFGFLPTTKPKRHREPAEPFNPDEESLQAEIDGYDAAKRGIPETQCPEMFEPAKSRWLEGHRLFWKRRDR